MSSHAITDATDRRSPSWQSVELPHKPLDNPGRWKPPYASEDELAELLAQVLRWVPGELQPVGGTQFPLLDALKIFDTSRGTSAARELVLIAAVDHRTADERRTAEYFLRNRHDVVAGLRTSASLLFAARYAAEMDVRRIQNKESPLPRILAAPEVERIAPESDSISVDDLVVATLRKVVAPMVLSPVAEHQIRVAAVIALDLAERYVNNGGRGSAVMAMRSDARSRSRLVTHLRNEFGRDAASNSLARLLVGPDSSSIDTALLRWGVEHDLVPDEISPDIRNRWRRCLQAIAFKCGESRFIHKF